MSGNKSHNAPSFSSTSALIPSHVSSAFVLIESHEIASNLSVIGLINLSLNHLMTPLKALIAIEPAALKPGPICDTMLDMDEIMEINDTFSLPI